MNSSATPPRRIKTPIDAFATGTGPRRPKLSPRAHNPSTLMSFLGGDSATKHQTSRGSIALDVNGRPRGLEQRASRLPTPHLCTTRATAPGRLASPKATAPPQPGRSRIDTGQSGTHQPTKRPPLSPTSTVPNSRRGKRSRRRIWTGPRSTAPNQPPSATTAATPSEEKDNRRRHSQGAPSLASARGPPAGHRALPLPPPWAATSRRPAPRGHLQGTNAPLQAAPAVTNAGATRSGAAPIWAAKPAHRRPPPLHCCHDAAQTPTPTTTTRTPS